MNGAHNEGIDDSDRCPLCGVVAPAYGVELDECRSCFEARREARSEAHVWTAEEWAEIGLDALIDEDMAERTYGRRS